MGLIHNIEDILSGWENFLEKPEEIEEVANTRATICASCPYAKKTMLLCMVKDDLTEIEGYYCSKCKCPLSAKVRSNSKCPINKW